MAGRCNGSHTFVPPLRSQRLLLRVIGSVNEGTRWVSNNWCPRPFGVTADRRSTAPKYPAAGNGCGGLPKLKRNLFSEFRRPHLAR